MKRSISSTIWCMSTVLLFIVLGFFVEAGWAQTIRGTIFGTITDSSGAVVQDATVTVTNLETGDARQVKTNNTGAYVVPTLLPGKYSVQSEKSGFAPTRMPEVELLVDARQQVDLKLGVAGAKEQVTVTGEAPIVETGSASVGQTIDQKTITDMPLNGRNFLQLTLLSAGAVPLGPTSDAASFGEPSVNISGGREASNQFTIDGVFDNAIHFDGLSLAPNVDAVQEFKVQRNTFGAEFGYGTAMVNVVTKSGTNQFHGSVYEFLRNDALDAKQYFDTTKPPFRQNQFGAVFGGPIIKNKTFFFFSYEGLRRRRSNTVTGTLPTAAMLSGDFAGQPPVINPQTGLPFPGNIIPQTDFSEITKRILPFLPQITAGGALNYQAVLPSSADYDQWSIRLDQRFSDNDSVFVRYSWANTKNYTPGLIAMTGNNVSDTPKNGGVDWTHSFTPNLLNDARLGFNRNLQVRTQDGFQDPALNVLQQANIVSIPENYGIPLVNITGYDGFGTSAVFPEIVGGNTLQFADTLTWVKGSHTLKFGGDFRNTQMPHTPYAFARGLYVFAGLATGNPVADFLLGNPFVSFGAGNGPSAFMSMKSFSLFAQDDWRVTRKLTLNLGLRYERLSALSDRTRGRLGVFDPKTGQVVAPADVEAAGLINPDNNNFGPRVGFAYDIFGDAKTVLRGGYGVYYDVKPFNEYNFSLGTELRYQQVIDIFPLLGLPPSVNWDNLYPASPGVGLGILTDDPYAITPMVHQWSLGIQRELPRNMMVELTYAGSAGRHLNGRMDLNQATLPAFPGDPLQPRRPYPALGSIESVTDIPISNYNSLQARWEKRFSNNLYFLAAYTWSKSMDTSSNNPEQPQDIRDVNAEYAPSSFDQRQRFVFSSSYLLPFGKGQRFASSNGVVNQIIGGWQFNSIVTIASGNPFSVQASGERTDTGVFGNGIQRANYTGSGSGYLPADQRSPAMWFDTSAFVAAPLGTFGNTGRNILVGPGTQNFDLSLFKMFSLTERFKLEFRSEFFNAFNKAQFGMPIADPTTGLAFGQIRTVRPAREIQFGLKLSF